MAIIMLINVKLFGTLMDIDEPVFKESRTYPGQRFGPPATFDRSQPLGLKIQEWG